MVYVIDRFEGTYAVCECENKNMIDIPISELPAEVKEGSKVEKTTDGYKILDNSDDKARIEKKFKSLFK